MSAPELATQLVSHKVDSVLEVHNRRNIGEDSLDCRQRQVGQMEERRTAGVADTGHEGWLWGTGSETFSFVMLGWLLVRTYIDSWFT
jgi:hypothetical protein